MAKESEIIAISRFNPVYYDTYANLPTTNLRTGMLAYATDRKQLYRWSGSAWVAITSYSDSGLASAIPTASDLAEGALYYETDTYLLKQVQSSAWAAVVIYSRSGTAAGIPTAGDLPEGSLYFETDTGLLKQVQSSAWTVINALDWVYLDSDNTDGATGALSFAAYDLIKIEFAIQVDTGDGSVGIRLNGVSSSDYAYTYIDAGAIGSTTGTSIKLIDTKDGYPAIGEILISGKHDGGRKVLTARVVPTDYNDYQLLNGYLTGDSNDLTSINILWNTSRLSGGYFRAYGKNLS